MKLFTVGPVEMYPETLRIGGMPIPYFRTAEFSEMMIKIEQNFLTLLNAPKDSRALVLTNSGTGAMDAAVINCLSKKDKILVINGGGFGQRFVEICERYGMNYEELRLGFGEALTKKRLLEYDDAGFTALLVNIHETSVGQLYDAGMLGSFCKKNNIKLIIDAISSFLADELDMSAIGAALILTSSQKALALPPGLALIAVTGEMYHEIMNNTVESLYLDFKDYFKNMERGQTPFTPAVGIVYQLSQRLEDICERGINSIILQHKERADYFRKLCRDNGIAYVETYSLSNALTPLYFPEGGAIEVFRYLKEKKDIIVTPSGGELSDRLLRVGHLGNLNSEDFDELIDNIVGIRV